MCTLRLRIRQTPPDHRGGYELEADEVVGQGVDYDEAYMTGLRLVPDGWQVVHVRRDDD